MNIKPAYIIGDCYGIKYRYFMFFEIKKSSYLNKLDVVQPFELKQNPSCCKGFSHAVHPHKRLDIQRMEEKSKINLY